MKHRPVFAALLLVSAISRAGDFSQIEDLRDALAEEELRKCMGAEGDCEDLSGVAISRALESQFPEPETSDCGTSEATQVCGCEADPKKRRRKKTRKKAEESTETEVLLVSEVHVSPARQGSIELNTFRAAGTVWDEYFASQPSGDPGWSMADLSRISKESSSNVQRQRSTFVEGLVQFASRSGLSERELAKKIAESIREHSNGDVEEQMRILTTIKDRIYWNFNAKRNPLQNTANDPIPQGNITLQAMLKAAAEGNPDQGGVCNDIAKAVATVGEQLFPDRDVLVINNGSHFGVLVHDRRKGNTIINWDIQTNNASQAMIDPNFPVGNTRMFQMHGGALKEIAVVDTESGAVMKKFFSSPTQSLITGTSPSVLYASAKKELGKREKKIALETKAGVARTSDAQMVILVAQRTKTGRSTQTSSGLGVAQHTTEGGDNRNVIVTLHSGIQKTIVHYQSPRLSILGSGGVELDAFGAKRVKQDSNRNNKFPAVSANLQTNQTVTFQSTPANSGNPSVSGQIQAVQAVGSRDEGARQGALADPEGLASIVRSMKFSGFYLNQVNARAAVNAPLSSKVTSITEGQYQGSAIGQRIRITSGIEVKSSGGTRVFMFVGAVDNDIGGFKTQGSLFSEPSGGVIGGGVQTRKGVELSTDFQGLGSAEKPPQGNLKLSVPVSGGKKKRK